MPLTPLVFNDKNFQDIRDRTPAGGFPSMNAIDFDQAFTKVVNFINDKIITELNQLLGGAVPGSTSPADINKFRRNVGDGTTEWASIGNDALDDFSLEFSKLSKCTPCSILATGADKIFKEVTTDQSNLTLISQSNSLPIWSKIKGENVENRQITGIKIARRTLNNNNFQVNLLQTQLIDNSVTGIKVVDRTIPTNKIGDLAVDTDILRSLKDGLTGRTFVGNRLVNVLLWGNTLPDGFVNNLNYFSLGVTGKIDYTNFIDGFVLPNGTTLTAIDQRNIADGAIANYQIANRSLHGQRLNQRTATPGVSILVRDINDLIGDGEITPQHLPAQYRTALGL